MGYVFQRLERPHPLLCDGVISLRCSVHVGGIVRHSAPRRLFPRRGVAVPILWMSRKGLGPRVQPVHERLSPVADATKSRWVYRRYFVNHVSIPQSGSLPYRL